MAPAKPNIVVALVSGYVGYKGESVKILEGESRSTDDPIVKAYPAFFGPQYVAGGERIEQATAAPGEKR